MLFSRSVSAGLQVLCYLSAEGSKNVISASALARILRLPRHQCAKILQSLAHHDLVRPNLGRRGGYELAHPLEQISLGEVLDALAGDQEAERLRPGSCTGRLSAACGMHLAILDLQARAHRALRAERLRTPDSVCGSPAKAGDPTRPPLNGSTRRRACPLQRGRRQRA